MKVRQIAPSFVISTIVHALILFALWSIVLTLPIAEEVFDVETVLLDEDRLMEEVVQELDEQKVSATTLNFVPGSVSATAVGGSNAPLTATKKIEIEQTFDAPKVRVNLAAQTLPGAEVLALELGQAEVTGRSRGGGGRLRRCPRPVDPRTDPAAQNG